MSITIQWDKPKRITKDTAIIDIFTGQTRAYINALDTLKAFHPRESSAIEDAIFARLEEFSKLGSETLPGIPEIAIIAYQTPKGERYCAITSCLTYTGARQGKRLLAKHETIVSMAHEMEDVLDHFGFGKTIERMLETEASV